MTLHSRLADAAEVFAAGEGDAWFLRNRARLTAFDPSKDFPLRMMRLFDVRPRRALEVGAANGTRLAAMREEFGAEVVGTDLSSAAIADGRARFGIELYPQPAHALELSGKFDFVLVNFVLHWVPRASLADTVQSIGDALEPGGLLMIGDFHPDEPTQVPYHHREDVELFTHKRDYSELFLAKGDMRLVGFLSGDHDTLAPRTGVPERERVGLWLLENRAQS